MESEMNIEDLKITQRFTLGGDVYVVRNVEFDIDNDRYNVTARGSVVDTDLELRVPSGAPFLTLR